MRRIRKSEIGVKKSDLGNWIAAQVALFKPARIHWCNGSQAEYDALCQQMCKTGTLIALNPELRPGCFLARSDAKDVARVEDRTFICSERKEDAGPTNRHMHPDLAIETLTNLSDGCMRGRTLYIIPFRMRSHYAVQLTDSPYVAANKQIMAGLGRDAFDTQSPDERFICCLHSVGMPLVDGVQDVPWPCNNEHKYICHFPERGLIWSFGSGYGGNALLGKKCFALRIASKLGLEEGWLAEHMLILGLESPEGEKIYMAAALPSACGKTTLSMLPPFRGWKVTTVSEDIGWIEKEPDGFYGSNPETGIFGVAPGTSWKTNPNAMVAISRDCLFTNVALTKEGDVWWEGMTDEAPEGLIDWQGQPWTTGCGRPAAHPNARFTARLSNLPSLDPGYSSPRGVKLSAIMFGGRRPDLMPLIVESLNWTHGVYLGATIASQTTAAADGKVGVLRRNPMAMVEFCGYDIGVYFGHWLKMGGNGESLPIFAINSFRVDEEGRFMWPGYADTLRVLIWIFRRVKGRVGAKQTPIGSVPRLEDMDLTGLDSVTPERFARLTEVDPDLWLKELDLHEEFFRTLGERVPRELHLMRELLQERFQREK